MRSVRLRVLLITLLGSGTVAGGALSAAAQEPAPPDAGVTPGPPQRPGVFFDCQGQGCNGDYYRTEIEWVNWVREPEASDVHVIVTNQATGAGGREFLLDFVGRGAFADYRDEVLLRTHATDTERERLDAMAHTLALGLARFADAAGYRGLVQLAGADPRGARAAADGLVSADQVSDPWNLWVFSVGASGELEGERTEKEASVNGSLSASRVTPEWRMSYRGNLDFNHQEIERSDGTVFRDRRTDWGVSGLLAYAMAGHWSSGVQLEVQRVTRENQDVQVRLMPGVEYSYFPYEQATRRSLTAFYSIGPEYRNYTEQTVYLQMEETRMQHRLEMEFSQRQTWGDAEVGVSGSQYLHDPSKYRLSLEGDVSFRVFRGLSLEVRSDVQWVNDQLYLSAEGGTDEEFLLRLRERASTFNYGMDVGFSYRFGSVFNNVVNNRYNGRGGGGGDWWR